jgi:predicted acylesterase/phospholipase RssA
MSDIIPQDNIECPNEQEIPTDISNKDLAKLLLLQKDCFCFEGGGVLGIGEVGSLVRLKELGGLNNIKSVVGTSVGSIISAALGCGASIDFIKDAMFGIDLQSFKDGSCFLGNAVRFIKKGGYGWYKGDEIENFMGRVLKELTGSEDITFSEAYNTYKIRLTIVYFSVTYGKTRYADYKSQPHLKIKEAVRRSSAIPAFYNAVWEKRVGKTRDVIVDGGITDNYPLHVLKEQSCPTKHILGFKLCSVEEINEYKEDAGEEVEDIDYGEPKNIYDYVMRLIGHLHSQALRYHVKEDDWKLTVKIDIGKYQTTDFDITTDELIWLFNQGKDALDKHLVDIEKMLDEGQYPL